MSYNKVNSDGSLTVIANVGSEIVANPTLAGTEDSLNGLEVDGTKFKVGITDAVKTALLACFANTAWANANGQTCYTALQRALNGSNPAESELASITATLQGTYTTSDSISDVTSHITVTATYDDTSTAEVTPFAVFDTTNVDMTTAGTYTIGVSYTEDNVTKTTTVSLAVGNS